MSDPHRYAGERIIELKILVPQTVFDWLSARADAEGGKAKGFFPDDVASAEVVSAMEYFIETAEADTAFEAYLAKRDAARARGEDVPPMESGFIRIIDGEVTVVPFGQNEPDMA